MGAYKRGGQRAYLISGRLGRGYIYLCEHSECKVDAYHWVRIEAFSSIVFYVLYFVTYGAYLCESQSE